ncbi:MAG: hypothetical protein BGO29_02610 [Bacteroidales bacterium 36-12]|nr:MAG: hypothetical protein BGO29_02610 [Bacteroidales bacterium 36-12]
MAIQLSEQEKRELAEIIKPMLQSGAVDVSKASIVESLNGVSTIPVVKREAGVSSVVRVPVSLLQGSPGEKGDSLDFIILGTYSTIQELQSAYPTGPESSGFFKVDDNLVVWTGTSYEPLNLNAIKSFGDEQFIEVRPSGSALVIDFSKTPYAKVTLDGPENIYNLSLKNTRDGSAGKILVFQSGFKQMSIGTNILGSIDLPLNQGTVALLNYNRIDGKIYIHSNTVIGDVQFPSPQLIKDFQTIYYDSSVCIVRWTAPYANTIYDKATEYDMRYSNNPVDSNDPAVWASLRKVSNLPAPAEYGTEQRFTISNLEPNKEYYIYLKSVKVNFGVKYTSQASDPAYCKTSGNPGETEGYYRLNLSTDMLWPRRKDGWLDSEGVVHGVQYITDETEKDSFNDDGKPDTTLRQYETFWRTPSSKHDNPFHFLVDMNQPHVLGTLYIMNWQKAAFRVFVIKDFGYEPEYVATSKQMYNGWEVFDLQGKTGRFIKLVYDVEAFAMNEANVSNGEECYPTANQGNLLGGIYKMFVYGRYMQDKPNKILPPARNARPKHTVDEFFCTNGHFYQQGRIHSKCSGSRVRLYGSFGHFGPPQFTDNYQRIADYRVRVDDIAWVANNNGTGKFFRDNIRDTFVKFGLKPFVAGTGIIDYCRWQGYTSGKDKNKCLDNYWLPGAWKALPSKGVGGTDNYFKATMNPLNYRTLSKTCNHLMGVYGDTPVNPVNLDLYPVEESTVNGLGYMDAIEHINEPDATWLGWMWYMQPEECAAQLSAIYDGHCGELVDEDGNKQKYGVKNINPNSLVLLPGMAGLHTAYIRMMYLWAKKNRKDGKFPCDVLNFHSYFSNIGNQGGDATIPVQYAITCEESLKNEVGGEFLVMADYRNRYLPDKEIWITEFGYGECGGANTQSKYQCYTQAGRSIGSWIIPDRHRSDVKGAWTIRAVLTMMRVGFDMCHYYSTEMEAPYFDNGQWGAGAGYEMFHWNDCKDTTPGAKAAAIKAYEHSYPRGGFALTGLFGPLLNCGAFPISRAYWWIATFRNRLKGYVYTGNKYIDSDERIMVYCFRKPNENKGAYVVYLNDSQNTGVPNVEIPLPSSVTTVKKVTVFVPELVSPEALPSNIEYDQRRTQLPTSRREKYINGAWVIQNAKWEGQYESFANGPAVYPPNPQEGDEVTVIPTAAENPYFPIVGPVAARYSSHGLKLGANQYEFIDPADPVDGDGKPKWTSKYNTALAWRQVDAVCDYIDYTEDGQHGINGDEKVVEVLRNAMIVNVSEFPEFYLFDAAPDPDFRSKVTDLSATPLNSTSVKLYWNNNNTEDTGYDIFASELPESGYSLLKTVSVDVENSAVVSGLTQQTTYYFKVRPVCGGKLGTLSDYTSAKTYSFLPAVQNLHSSSRTATGISLNWEYTSEQLSDFVHFAIYRAGTDGNFKRVGSVDDKNITTYTDNGLSVGTTYVYKVRAVGLNGQSEYSTELEVRTLLASECSPVLLSAITDKLGSKVTLTFDLDIASFDVSAKDSFILTEDNNRRLITMAYADESNTKTIVLKINQDSLSDYDKKTNIRIAYEPPVTGYVKSTYGVKLEGFSDKRVANIVGNFTDVEAIFKVNLTGDGNNLPVDVEWNNLIGNPETSVIKLSNLVDTYGRSSAVSIENVLNSPSLVWGGPSSGNGTCSLDWVERNVYSYGWSVAYRALVTENIVARLKLSSLNPEHKYTIKAYASYNNVNAVVPSARIKVNNIYSNIVALTGNQTSFMVIEDCVPLSNGEMFIDFLPMRESTSTAVPFQFILIEEYRSSSEPENKDIWLRDISVKEDNGSGAVTTDNVHVYLNYIGTATHYRIAETETALASKYWTDVPVDMLASYVLSDGFALKTLFVQVKNAYNESNIRSIQIEYKDPYVPLVLKEVYINNDKAQTNERNVSVFFVKDGIPSHYRIGETADLTSAPWIPWPSNNPTEVHFEVSAGSGQKTVYAQIKDAITTSLVKVDTISYIELEYEDVTLSVELPEGFVNNGVNVSFAPLKYNKSFAYGVTSDDGHVSAWNVLFKYFNGMWIDDAIYFHKFDVNGNLNQRGTGSFAPRALTYTDGFGNKRRFAVGTANLYSGLNDLVDAGGNQYPYLLWPEVKEMLDFDGAITLHDVMDPALTTYGGTVENIVNGINSEQSKILAVIGRKAMCMTEPNGDSKYTTAAELVNDIRIITKQHRPDLGFDYQDLKNPLINIEKLKVARYFNENPTGVETYKQDFLSSMFSKPSLYGEFGCHGVDKNKAAETKVWPSVSGFFDWLCDTYGEYGNDSIWFATNDEVIQYKALCALTTLSHRIEGRTLTISMQVPVIENFYWKEFTLLIDGVTDGTLIESSNVIGLSYGTKESRFMINVNLDATLTTRAEKYTALFESTLTNEDKASAEYFIQRLKPSLQGTYTSRINTATAPPVLTAFTINAGEDVTNSLSVVCTFEHIKAKQYMVSESATFEGAVWKNIVGNSLPYTLPDIPKTHTLYFKLKNNFGESSVMSDTITYTPVQVGIYSVYINDGNAKTFDANVKVTFAYVGTPSHCRLGNSSDLSALPWEVFNPSGMAYLLENSSYGIKTVYAQLRDAYGNISEIVSASIEYASIPKQTVVWSLTGKSNVIEYPVLDTGETINKLLFDTHTAYSSKQFRSTSGELIPWYVELNSSYYVADSETGAAGTYLSAIGSGQPTLGGDMGVYKDVYLTRSYLTNGNCAAGANKGKIQFTLPVGLYKIKILLSVGSGSSFNEAQRLASWYKINVNGVSGTPVQVGPTGFTGLNNTQFNAEIDIVVNQANDRNVILYLYNTSNLWYRPGVNLIEIIKTA